MIMGLGRVIQFAFVIPSCTLKIVSDFRSVISYMFLIRLCNIDDAQPKNVYLNPYGSSPGVNIGSLYSRLFVTLWCVHKLAGLVSRSLYECVTGPSVVSLQLYHRPLPLWRTARGLGGETTHGGDRGRGRSE